MKTVRTTEKWTSGPPRRGVLSEEPPLNSRTIMVRPYKENGDLVKRPQAWAREFWEYEK